MFFLVADLTLLRTKGKGAPTHTPRLKIGICFHLWFDKDTIKVTWVLQIWTVRWIARPCQHHRSYFTWILCWFGLRCHGQIWISIYAPYVSQLPIMWEYWNTLVVPGNLKFPRFNLKMTLTERKKILQNTFNFSPKISLYPQRWQEKKDSLVANGKTACKRGTFRSRFSGR